MSTLRRFPNALTDTVSISQFNRGQAAKIFHQVRSDGAKVVMKNNVAEAVVLSPEEYLDLIESVEDAELLELALERRANHDPATRISFEEVLVELGITESELEEIPEVEFE